MTAPDVADPGDRFPHNGAWRHHPDDQLIIGGQDRGFAAYLTAARDPAIPGGPPPVEPHPPAAPGGGTLTTESSNQ